MANEQQNRLLGALESKGAQVDPVTAFEQRMRAWWKDNGRKIENLTGSKEAALSMLTSALVVVQRTPDILKCTFESFVLCLLQSAETDLWPGSAEEVGYVPKEIKGVWTVCFWPMYKGHLKHMYATGQYTNISCQMVRENDEFDFNEGSKPFIHFKRSLKSDAERGKEVCGFFSADFVNGGRQIEIVSMDYLAKVEAQSPSSRSDFSPWKRWPESMKRKTCLKVGQKWCPKSDRLSRIIELDNIAERPDLAKPKILDLSNLSDITGSTKMLTGDTRTSVDFSTTSNAEPEKILASSEAKNALMGERK